MLSHPVPGDGEFTTDEGEAKAGVGFDGKVVCGVELDQFDLPAQ